jgi:hypothetical protein
MTHESRIEVIIFAGLAVFLAALWWLNRAQGGGTGMENVLPIGLGGSSAALPSSTGPTFYFGAPSGADCGCPTCTQNGSSLAFGTDAGFLDYINSLGLNSTLTAALQPGGSN